MTDTAEARFRCGYAAILGKPNVGKSTLLNSILDFKLSIVTPKPQTTRHRILGIYNDASSQVIFLDTPGLISPKYKLHEFLNLAAKSAASDADVLLMLLDAREASADELATLPVDLSHFAKPIVLCLNKIDLMEKNALLPKIDALSKLPFLREIVPISALKKDGTDRLLACLQAYLPASPPLYPPDQLSVAPERFFASELIREKIFLRFGDEVPYSTAVLIEEFIERPGKKDYIRARVLVERESQKAILIGKGGRALKAVGSAARQAIEAMLERPIFLELIVSVRPKWRQSERELRRLGYHA